VGLAPSALEEAGGLDAGAFRLQSSVLWFNTYRQTGLAEAMTQRVDMEGLLPIVSAAWSPAPGWELRAQAQGWTLGGGVMDPFLASFHGVLGIPNQGRDLAPTNGYRNDLAGWFDDRTPRAGLTQASAAVRAFSGPWSWTAWTKVPVGSHEGWAWTNQWGGGLAAGWGDRWPWADLGLTLRWGAEAALVVVQEDPSFPDPRGPWAGQTGVYFIVEGFSGLRALVEGTWTSVPRAGAGYLPQGAGLLTLGVQGPLGPAWAWEGALTEEFFTWATMEVGFQAGLVWTP